jgi:hypothetical protein
VAVDEMVTFIRARLDEIEQDAKAAIGTAVFRQQTGQWIHMNVPDEYGPRLIVFAIAEGPDRPRTQVADLTAAWEGPERAVHITRHDPQRVLADVAMRRKMVANLRTAIDHAWQFGEEAREVVAQLAVMMLQRLAALDVDHPDYDPGWAL